MTAGVPGAGLGGLLYLLLVLMMPARGLWLTSRGRGGEARWRAAVGVQAGLAAGIVAVLWAEGWALGRLPALLERAGLAHGLAGRSVRLAEAALEHVVPALALAPLVVLALVWAGTHALRLAVRGGPAARPSPPPIPLASEAERRRVRAVPAAR